MPNCAKIKQKPYKICTGDLSKRITLYVRSITDPQGGSVDFGENFTTPTNVWAMIETLSKGVEIFDGSNVIDVATHLFYIRYIPGITFEMYLDYNGRRFRIIDVQNIDEKDETIILRCTERGDNTKPVNWS